MNTAYPNTQPRPKFYIAALIALLALMVMVLTASIGKTGHARVSIPSLPVQTVQGETVPH